MKTLFRSLLAAVAIASLGACAAMTTAPTDAEVTQIKNACLVDATIRPTVDVLMVFATPEEKQGLALARAVIDPVCANPTAPIEASALTAFSTSITQVAALVVQLRARKPTPADSASSPG